MKTFTKCLRKLTVAGIVCLLFSTNSFSQFISGGVGHSLNICTDGTVNVTGWNADGQLGNGSNTDVSTPIQVSGLSDVSAVVAGDYHSLFLKSDGTVWAAGANTDGQLGDGTNTSTNTPVQVTGLSSIVAIEAGDAHSLFLKK